MTESTQASFDFPTCKCRPVEATFDGGDITSKAGVLLLQQADRRLGSSAAVAQALHDPVRGPQEGRFFDCYHDHYGFLPLYVFCGKQLLVSR